MELGRAPDLAALPDTAFYRQFREHVGYFCNAPYNFLEGEAPKPCFGHQAIQILLRALRAKVDACKTEPEKQKLTFADLEKFNVFVFLLTDIERLEISELNNKVISEVAMVAAPVRAPKNKSP